MHHQQGNFPDLSAHYGASLSAALEQDGLNIVTPRMEKRLAKLASELLRHSRYQNRGSPARQPRHFCEAVSFLRRSASDTKSAPDSTLGNLVDDADRYLAMYSP